MDTTSSIALLQEESSKDVPRREFRKHDMSGNFKYHNKPHFNNTIGNQSNARTGDTNLTPAKRASGSSKGVHSEDKMTTLMNYRKAKGLCYKCGQK